MESLNEHLRLVVAIPTFKRPARLAALLPLVGDQLRALRNADHSIQTSILVVDNDPAASARAVVDDDFAGSPTQYVVETTPGIPAVRNRALDQATSSDLLAFIDDDELPLEGWVSALVTTWREYNEPAAVMGRVVSILADDVDPWVVGSGVFYRPLLKTGTEISAAATGNLLLDMRQVRLAKVRFEEKIGLGGGSDTLFSMTLKRTGARLVWCNESVAEDTVEPERQTRAWVLKRAYSHGNITTVVQLRLATTPSARAVIRIKSAAGGMARIVFGSLRSGAGVLLRSDRHRARGRRLIHRGAGMIGASLGRSYAAYARSASTPSVA